MACAKRHTCGLAMRDLSMAAMSCGQGIPEALRHWRGNMGLLHLLSIRVEEWGHVAPTVNRPIAQQWERGGCGSTTAVLTEGGCVGPRKTVRPLWSVA